MKDSPSTEDDAPVRRVGQRTEVSSTAGIGGSDSGKERADIGLGVGVIVPNRAVVHSVPRGGGEWCRRLGTDTGTAQGEPVYDLSFCSRLSFLLLIHSILTHLGFVSMRTRSANNSGPAVKSKKGRPATRGGRYVLHVLPLH